MNDTQPPPRTRAEFDSVLNALSASSAGSPKPLTLCLVAGEKDHGPGEHEYLLWQQRWQTLLSNAPGVMVETACQWPESTIWKNADLVVLYFWNHDWNPRRYADLDGFLARGGGVVVIHSSMVEDHAPDKLAQRFGLAGQRPQLQFRHGPLRLDTKQSNPHPIVQGVESLNLADETYWQMVGDVDNIDVLATAHEADQACPMLWTHRHGEGRVFCAVPGHYAWTFDDPIYRIILLRGMAWAAGEDTARFQAIAAEGIDFATE